MIILADSGSTKTTWRLIFTNSSQSTFETEGINPYYQSREEIRNFLQQKVIPKIREDVSEFHFYGAGCTSEKEDFVREAVLSVLPARKIEVKSDLWGAARALCFDQKGIACILGTGSNSCYYDGERIVQNIPPLGYVLGDEGSASVMGKNLVADYLKRIMPESLRSLFEEKYAVSTADVLNRVYRSEFPNRYLSGFAPFLSANIGQSYCEKLVITEFQNFIRRNVLNYAESRTVPISFVGSVAWYFESQLRMVLQSNGLVIGKIVKQPIDLLTEYHLKRKHF